jgi:predicted alpha/beta-fold hydrolase
MPIIGSTYKPPFLLGSATLQTVIPTFFRKIKGFAYQRERIELEDGDFLDIDWSKANSKNKLVIVIHGLEASSHRDHVEGMIKAFNKIGWDGVGYNYRGCSGEPNRLVKSYHTGSTDDFRTVVNYIIKKYPYQEIAIIGFSIGGNIVLKYLGEEGKNLHKFIKHAAAISVPCDLAACSDKVTNSPYRSYFLNKYYEKLKAKSEKMPGKIDLESFKKVKTLADYDDLYIAPIFGFKDAQDYYAKATCKPLLKNITIPTLVIIAKDDPFMKPSCYPVEEAKANDNLYLEMPDKGGHVGFILNNKENEYWQEKRVKDFVVNHDK